MLCRLRHCLLQAPLRCPRSSCSQASAFALTGPVFSTHLRSVSRRIELVDPKPDDPELSKIASQRQTRIESYRRRYYEDEDDDGDEESSSASTSTSAATGPQSYVPPHLEEEALIRKKRQQQAKQTQSNSNASSSQS